MNNHRLSTAVVLSFSALSFLGLFLAVPSVMPSARAADGASLAEQAKCGTCHALDGPLVGPSYKAISERYRGDDTALATLLARARAGSTPGAGEWGPVPMPPVTPEQLSDEDLSTVLSWILAR